MFLTLMVIGLVGLAMMAIPAFGRHGHAHPGHAGHHGGALGRGAGHAHAPHALGPARAANGGEASEQIIPADAAPAGVWRFVPSPRAVFSVLALYGAFANAFVVEAHLSALVAGLAAVVPALVFERFAVTPLWNLLFRFQGEPSSPLEALVCCEARAVTPFRNGRGLVSVTRDGRLVQLAARLRECDAAREVKVGDKLQVEDIDARRERVTVSISRD